MDKHTINTATLTRVCGYCADVNMERQLSQIELSNTLNSVKGFVQIDKVSKLSNQELIDLTQNIEKLGQFIDYARVAVAGEIDVRGTASFTGETTTAFKPGVVAASSWYDPNTEAESLDSEDTGIENTRFNQSRSSGAASCSCDNHASDLDDSQKNSENLDLASLTGCRNTRELIQRLTLAPIATINKQLRLAKALAPEVTLAGEILPVKYPAISYGLNKGVLPVETARLITDELNNIVRDDNREKVLTAELLLVAATTGGDTTAVENILGQGVKGFYQPELLNQVIQNNTRLQEDYDSVKTMANIWTKMIEQESRPLTLDENIDKRFFRIGREKDGLVRISGLLMPEIAALLGNLVTAVNSPRVNNNQDLGTSSNTSADVSDNVGTNCATGTGVFSKPGINDNTGTGSDTSGNISTGTSGNSSTGRIESNGGAVATADSDANTGGADATTGVTSETGSNASDSDSASDSASKVRFTQSIPEQAGDPTCDNTTNSGVGVDTQRTHAQKSHDALALILQAAVKAAETPTLGGAPVTVLIEVKAKDLDKEQGFGLLHDHHGETHPTSLTQIKHSACSGATQKIITGENGKIISLGNLERVFNHHQRRAITLRDKGCIIPGCSVPAVWCEIHHVTEHAKGGATHTSNGVTLCWWHHRNLDNSGWEIMMRDEYPWVKPPKWLNPDQTWQKHQPQGVIPEILRS